MPPETKRKGGGNIFVLPHAPLFQDAALTPIALHKLESVSALQFQNANSAILKTTSTWVIFKSDSSLPFKNHLKRHHRRCMSACKQKSYLLNNCPS